MGCFDLSSWAEEHRYRWRFEESYTAEKAPEVRGEVGWYGEVLCRRGLIYLARADELLAFTDKPSVLRELLALGPDVRVHRRAEDGSRPWAGQQETARTELLQQLRGVVKIHGSARFAPRARKRQARP
jgi:hypothetical protein